MIQQISTTTDIRANKKKKPIEFPQKGAKTNQNSSKEGQSV